MTRRNCSASRARDLRSADRFLNALRVSVKREDLRKHPANTAAATTRRRPLTRHRLLRNPEPSKKGPVAQRWKLTRPAGAGDPEDLQAFKRAFAFPPAHGKLCRGVIPRATRLVVELV